MSVSLVICGLSSAFEPISFRSVCPFFHCFVVFSVLDGLIVMSLVKHVDVSHVNHRCENVSVVRQTASVVLLKPRRAAPDVNRVRQVNPLGNRKRPLLLSRHTAASDTERLGVPKCSMWTAAASRALLISAGSELSDSSAAYPRNQASRVV